MITPETITQIGRQIIDALPETAKTTQREIEKNVHAILQSTIAKLDLVSRDEFDAQVAVLRRTREKLEQMELTLAKLEQNQQVQLKPATKRAKKAPAKSTAAKKATAKKT